MKFLCLLPVLTVAADSWAALRDGAQAWKNLDFGGNFAIVAGDNTGAKFDDSWGHDDMRYKPIAGQSFSKFTSVVMMANMVNHGIMSFDEPARKYVKWWEQDPKKALYSATLRHMLSFTTGFRDDMHFDSICLLPTYDACAEHMYKDYFKKNAAAKPNTTWTYLSIHLQMAGAMALAAAKEHDPNFEGGMEELFHKYLYTPFNMSHTEYKPKLFPAMAVGVHVWGDDIHNLLRRIVSYEVLPKSIMDEVEFDYSGLVPDGPRGSTDGWWGHYGMGSWVECLGYGIAPHVNNKAPLTKRCKAQKLHSAVGGSGVYPLWDRSMGGGLAGPTRNQSYFGVLVDEPLALTGLPEYFRIMAKPLADVLMGGHDLANISEATLLSNGGLIHRDIKYLQDNLKECTCEHQANKGEPWASLTKGLPAVNNSNSRETILQAPDGGLTLRRFTQIAKTLGTCSCQGRSGLYSD